METPPNGKAILEHVAMVVLKQQAKDGPLAKALDQGCIHMIMDVLALSQPTRDALTYQEDIGTVKPLSFGYKGMLRMLKIFANYCQTDGTPSEQLQKRILMTSDAVRHVWLPLRRVMHYLPLPLLLPLNRKISLLTSKRDQEKCFLVHGVEGCQASSGTHTSTAVLWHRLEHKMF